MGRKKLIALVVAIPTLIVVVFVVVMAMDGSSPNDSTLLFKYTPIPAEDNAFSSFDAAGNLVYADVEIDECSLPAKWDADVAKELVERHARSLVLLGEGLTLPQLQVPEIKSFDDELSYLSRWRTLARLMSIKARFLAERGQVQDALKRAVDIVEFGQVQETSNGSLINVLVAISVKHIGLSRIRQIINDHDVPSSALAVADAHLETMTSKAKGMQDAFRVEYTMTANFLDALKSGKKSVASLGLSTSEIKAFAWMPFVFKKNRTKTKFANGYKSFFDSCTMRYQNRERLVVNRPKPLRAVLSGNAIGEMLYAMLMPALTSAVSKQDRLDVELGATRLQLAIKAYRNDHDNAWPDSLEALVPSYLKKLPDDPFAKKPQPLKYSPKARIVYTVGEDGSDT